MQLCALAINTESPMEVVIFNALKYSVCARQKRSFSQFFYSLFFRALLRGKIKLIIKI